MLTTTIANDERVAELEIELAELSKQLGQSFEELSLFHELSGSLDITSDRLSHCRTAIEKLAGCFTARTLAVLLSSDDQEAMNSLGKQTIETLTFGEPLDSEVVQQICNEIGSGRASVVNHPLRCEPRIDRAALVPLVAGTRAGSCLLVIGHAGGDELGTIEVRLMESVAMILNAHLEIQRQFENMQDMFEGTVCSLVSAIDAKDPYTCGHSSRVSSLAESLAREMGLSAAMVETTRMSGLLHDIGKIGVSDAVLRKPGKLDEAEYDEIKKHPELGHRILCGIRQFREMLPGVLHHHESWDGKGYPHGLVGEEIPLIARIIAVADAFDAMTSDRPYRAGMSIETVEAIFREGRGRQWDVNIVDALLADVPEMLRNVYACGLSTDRLHPTRNSA